MHEANSSVLFPYPLEPLPKCCPESQVEQQLVVDEFLAFRKRTGALEFAEFIDLCNVVIKSERRRLRWELRMQNFLSEESLTRIAQENFTHCADSK